MFGTFNNTIVQLSVHYWHQSAHLSRIARALCYINITRMLYSLTGSFNLQVVIQDTDLILKVDFYVVGHISQVVKQPQRVTGILSLQVIGHHLMIWSVCAF